MKGRKERKNVEATREGRKTGKKEITKEGMCNRQKIRNELVVSGCRQICRVTTRPASGALNHEEWKAARLPVCPSVRPYVPGIPRLHCSFFVCEAVLSMWHIQSCSRFAVHCVFLLYIAGLHNSMPTVSQRMSVGPLHLGSFSLFHTHIYGLRIVH